MNCLFFLCIKTEFKTHTNSMQQPKIAIMCLCGIFLLVVLFIFPINAKVKIYINLIDLRAYYVVKILEIKLLCGMAMVEGTKFAFYNTHNKIIKEDKEKQKKEGLFIRQIIKHINAHKLDLYFEFGSNDASLSALVSGYAQLFFSALCAFTLAQNKYVHVFESVVTNCQTQTCEAAFQLVIGISIFKIIKAKIIANKMHKENVSGK